MKNITLGFLLVFLSFNIIAQEIKVVGQIQNKDSICIPYGNIVFKSIKKNTDVFGTLSDEKGFFTIELVKDSYLVEISIVGIKPKKIELDLLEMKDTKDLGIIIVDTAVALDELVITSNKTQQRVDIDKKIYNVDQDIVAKGGTLTDMLHNLPSVQMESGGNVSIRGDQNVVVLIDGKPSGLTNSSDLFSTIPAKIIEKIEVITSPSSKYSAEGTAGIINVVLKKGKLKKINSSIEVFSGYRLKGGFNGNITKRNENGNWYINSGVGYSEPKAVNNIFLQSFDIVPDISTQKSERVRKQYYFLANLGGTKHISPRSSISGSIMFRGVKSNNNNRTQYEDYNNDILIETSERNEKEDEANRLIQANIGYDYSLGKEGHSIKISVSGELNKDSEYGNIIGKEIFPITQDLSRDNVNINEEINNYVVSLDYTLPFNDNKIELGYRSDISSIKSDFEVIRFQIIVPEFTDNMKYNENIHAFYGQFSNKFNKFSMKFGLRAEISDTNIKSKKSSEKKYYKDFFPSSFFTYSYNEKNKLRLSLSRRINRASNWMIVPFSTFTDERNVFVGNPEINPSYTLTSELSYTSKISNRFSFYPTLYYRKTKDEMEFYVEKQEITLGGNTKEVFASTIVNIGDYYAFGTEMGVSYKPFNWWNMYAEVIFNGFKQIGSYKGSSFDGNGMMTSGRFNTNFNLFKLTKLQIQNFYRGPIETGQYRRKGFYGTNIGISNKIFNNKGILALNVKDVFNSNIRKVTTFGDDFTRNLELQYRSRQITLSFIYKFRDKQQKEKQGNQYDKFDIVN